VSRPPSLRAIGVATLGVLAASTGAAGAPVPPWIAEGEVPPAPWARSVAPKAADDGGPGDMVLFGGPTRAGGRRGVTRAGATLPFFGAKRGSGCSGVWWLVGPLAWVCSDEAWLSGAPPEPRAPTPGEDGLRARYFFVRGDGASAYASLDSAQEGTADRELEGGWAVAAVQQRTAPGPSGTTQGFVLTTKGVWIALSDLSAARPSTFRGEALADGALDVAWVLADKASVWTEASTKHKPSGARVRFELVRVHEISGAMVRVDEAAWMQTRDLARPTLSTPPAEVTRPDERWVDVELASQTLVAYEGARPVYATLVSTGRPDSPTPTGAHRVWVKLEATDMDNVERGDLDAHYSMEDVPYTQFFEHGVALHGTYWHRDFGHTKSHGCVNLAPLDAKWLFAFTGPHLAAGWVAALPVPVDPGSVVRVR